MNKYALIFIIVIGLSLACGSPKSTPVVEAPTEALATSIPATNTPKPADTSIPATNTPKPTSTPIPATNTPEPTKTPTPKPPTSTPIPTFTPDPATATSAPTRTPRPSSAPAASAIEVKTVQETYEKLGFTFERSGWLIGASRSGSALVVLEGEKTLSAATITVEMPPNDEVIRMENVAYMLGLVKLTIPEWKEGPTWVADNTEKVVGGDSVTTTKFGRTVKYELFSAVENGMVIYVTWNK